MSANRESQSYTETGNEKPDETGKVREIKSDFNNFKDLDGGSEQNQKEIISTENAAVAFYCVANNHYKELRIIEKQLSEIILRMEIRESFASSIREKSFLREEIEEGMILQREIKMTLGVWEPAIKYMQLQLTEFCKSVSREKSDALTKDGTKQHLVKLEQRRFNLTYSEEVDEFILHVELDSFKRILQASKERQKMATVEKERVLSSTEDVIEAFFYTVDNQRKVLRTIEGELPQCNRIEGNNLLQHIRFSAAMWESRLKRMRSDLEEFSESNNRSNFNESNNGSNVGESKTKSCTIL